MSLVPVFLLLLSACEPTVELTETDADGDGSRAGVDCDDGDPDVFPGADELCSGKDDDCDGVVDEEDALDAATWYADADGDGFGEASSEARACAVPSGFVEDHTDCDDTQASVHPGAEERCNDRDDDCDGQTDEEAVDASVWYLDEDGDGWGAAGQGTSACDRPSGHTAEVGDCDDADALVHPEAQERCDDGDDQDCDGLVDCEDGECALDPVCYEDCTDGTDDDGDGLTDCEDDGCWGTAACGPVQMRLSSGRASATRKIWGYSYPLVSCSHPSWNRVQWANLDIDLSSVRGTAWLIPSGGTAQVSCSWRYDRRRLATNTYRATMVTLSTTLGMGHSSIRAHTTTGFQVGVDCPASLERVLPWPLVVDGSYLATLGGQPWAISPAYDLASSTGSFYDCGLHWSYRTHLGGHLDPGSTLSLYPPPP